MYIVQDNRYMYRTKCTLYKIAVTCTWLNAHVQELCSTSSSSCSSFTVHVHYKNLLCNWYASNNATQILTLTRNYVHVVRFVFFLNPSSYLLWCPIEVMAAVQCCSIRPINMFSFSRSQVRWRNRSCNAQNQHSLHTRSPIVSRSAADAFSTQEAAPWIKSFIYKEFSTFPIISAVVEVGIKLQVFNWGQVVKFQLSVRISSLAIQL